jgi:hypothetical protein
MGTSPLTVPQWWRHLLIEAVIAGLATWFVVVAVTALPSFRPQPIQIQFGPGSPSYLEDFGVFYTAGRMLRDGRGREVYRLNTLGRAESQTFGERLGDFEVLPFFNPPHALLLFAPLTALSLQSSAAVWLVSSMLLAAVGLILLFRTYPSNLGVAGGACLALGIISSRPAYQASFYGQISYLLVFGLCLLYLSIVNSDARLSVPGLLILTLKPQFLVLPVVLLLAQRRYRELLITASLGLVLLASALWFTGPRSLIDFGRLLVSSTAWTNENGITTFGMFGWVGMVSDAMGSALPRVQRVLIQSLDILTVAVCAWVIWIGVRRRSRPESLLSIAVVGVLLASPHFYPQDLLLLVPVLLVLMHSRNGVSRLGVSFAIAGWFTAYLHFEVLGSTGINITTVYLLGLVATLALMSLGIIEDPGRRARSSRVQAPETARAT